MATPEVEQVVRWLCVAVEESCVNGVALDAAYHEAQWRVPLEKHLETVEEWSLATSRARREQAGSQCRRSEAIVTEWERLLASTVKEAIQSRLQAQWARIESTLAHQKTQSAAPASMKVTTIAEDLLETRWNTAGRPQPLQRNALGEAYASPQTPLAYLWRRSAAEVFRLMKPRVKAELRAREVRRIERLNAAHREQLCAADALLEAKLDARLRRPTKV